MFDASTAAGTDSQTHTRTHPHTWGLVFLLVVPFNEEEGVKGLGGALCGFYRISGVVPLQMRQKLKKLSQLQPRFYYSISNPWFQIQITVREVC